jgi:hypothetical protein
MSTAETRQPDMTRLLRLARRAQEGRRGSIYRSDLLAFLRDCVWTYDEAAGGEIRRFPAHYPYMPDLVHDAMTEPRQMWEKARRVLASWFACAMDLWIVAGGYDPRWPTLMPTEQNPDGRNRRVIIAARKLEGLQSSSWFLSERVKFIYDEFIRRGYHETHWPGFPEIRWNIESAVAANGGRINAVPQGADQLRGPGSTLIHWEEASFCPELRASVMGSLSVIKGGGHILLITTAAADTFAAKMALDEVDP